MTISFLILVSVILFKLSCLILYYILWLLYWNVELFVFKKIPYKTIAFMSPLDLVMMMRMTICYCGNPPPHRKVQQRYFCFVIWFDYIFSNKVSIVTLDLKLIFRFELQHIGSLGLIPRRLRSLLSICFRLWYLFFISKP